MSKGMIGLGPALIFVNFFALLANLAAILVSLGLVSGIAFNKKIKETSLLVLLPRVIVFVTLTIGIIIIVHFIGGPTSNHYIGMILGTLAFAAIVTLLSINSIKQDAKSAWPTIAILTALFLFISEMSVYLTLR